MILTDLLYGALVALICGLDRTAVMQVMISRPIVAAPLVAWLLGDIEVGLQIGVMVELLWMARLPVGAAIPPDDTQVAISSCVLAITMGQMLGHSGLAFVLLCLLVAIPLGKFGQYFDRFARQVNGTFLIKAEKCINEGKLAAAERKHLAGILSFSLAALGTYILVVAAGIVLVPILVPVFMVPLQQASGWLQIALPLVGIAVILGTINVNRSLTLFSASFGMAFLLMWLV